MADVSIADFLAPRDAGASPVRLPWYVCVSPEFYNDPDDTGYGWEGWATDADDALAQALERCHIDNDRDEDCHDEDVDPAAASVHVVEVDFRRIAPALMHWADQMGGFEAPIWRVLEQALAAAGLKPAPLQE